MTLGPGGPLILDGALKGAAAPKSCPGLVFREGEGNILRMRRGRIEEAAGRDGAVVKATPIIYE